MANRFAQNIEKLLEPLVGGFVGKMAIKSQCKSLGISPDDIGPQHLDALSKKIGAALSSQGHASEADSIIRKIKSLT